MEFYVIHFPSDLNFAHLCYLDAL